VSFLATLSTTNHSTDPFCVPSVSFEDFNDTKGGDGGVDPIGLDGVVVVTSSSL
jgi:hypothetical protein